MIALVGAMFVAMAPARAAELGACTATGTNYLLLASARDEDSPAADLCTVQPANAADTVDPADVDDGVAAGTDIVSVGVNTNVITITAAAAGSTTVTDNNGTETDTSDDRTFDVVVLDGLDATSDNNTPLDPNDDVADPNYRNNAGVGAAIEFSDTDGVVAAGKVIQVNVAMRYGGDVDVVFNGGGLNFIFGHTTTTDLSDDALVPQVRLQADPQPGKVASDADSGIDAVEQWVEPTKVDGVARSYKYNLFTGSTPGEYTIRATIGIERDGSAITAEKTLTVGDPGDAVAEVNLQLSTRGTSDTTDDETDRTAKDTTIELEYEVLNSLGERANSPDLSVIQVSAANGLISVGSGVTVQSNQPGGVTFSEANRQAKGTFTVGSHQNKERSVEVTITAIAGGKLATDSIMVYFVGALDAITIDDTGVGTMHNSNTAVSTDKDGDDEDALDKRDTLVFKFSGTDSSANSIALSKPSATVTSKATGKTVHMSQVDVSVTEAVAGRGYNRVTLNNNTASTSPLATGTYVLTVASSATKKDSVEFTVVGGVDSVAIEIDDMAPDALADIINATVMVHDSEGNPVADGTKVSWTPNESGDSKIVRRTGSLGDVSTKAGVAKATFVTVGPGTEVITAVTGGKSAAAVVVSTAGAVEPEAMPEEEASVACLSNLAGFATWACGVESSASEIFGLVSGRGATALHLWNGSAWVRYSVVDGTMVPGSSDFMVAENDILYISN